MGVTEATFTFGWGGGGGAFAFCIIFCFHLQSSENNFNSLSGRVRAGGRHPHIVQHEGQSNARLDSEIQHEVSERVKVRMGPAHGLSGGEAANIGVHIMLENSMLAVN